MILSVRHLKTSANFQYGFILSRPSVSIVNLYDFNRVGGTYPSVVLRPFTTEDRMSIIVKAMASRIAARRIPKRGLFRTKVKILREKAFRVTCSRTPQLKIHHGSLINGS